ncbi:MAG: methyltransferase domain-containing protein, partial [bacterium]
MSQVEVDQAFLDTKQYASNSILDYEAVYGTDYVSPGGQAMATELLHGMGLTSDAKVLDVGCGLGGSAFLMVQEFGFRVTGIDLSSNMIEMARAKLKNYGLEDAISLIHGDCLELEDAEEYEGIYS